MVPGALDNLTAEERHSVYKMLQLRVVISADGSLEITGVFGGPLGAEATRSVKTEDRWLQIPQFRRTHGLRFRALLTEGATWHVELVRA
jgi:hypothetical protein